MADNDNEPELDAQLRAAVERQKVNPRMDTNVQLANRLRELHSMDDGPTRDLSILEWFAANALALAALLDRR